MRQIGFVWALILFVCTYVEAKDLPKNNWNYGQVVLKNGEVIKGDIQYDLKQNVALVKSKGLVKAYSVYNVDFFRFMDEHLKMIRSFYSMPYTYENGQQRLMFFELVFEDGFALFNRELDVAKQQAMVSKQYYVEKAEDELVTIFNYFILTPDGTFRSILNEQGDLAEKLSLNKRERKEMRNFISDHNLDLQNRADFIKVIYKLVLGEQKMEQFSQTDVSRNAGT